MLDKLKLIMIIFNVINFKIKHFFIKILTKAAKYYNISNKYIVISK